MTRFQQRQTPSNKADGSEFTFPPSAKVIQPVNHQPRNADIEVEVRSVTPCTAGRGCLYLVGMSELDIGSKYSLASLRLHTDGSNNAVAVVRETRGDDRDEQGV